MRRCTFLAACTCAFALLPAGCAVRSGIAELPVQRATPLLAQFGARAGTGGQMLPLQGELQLTAAGEGRLTLILPHGRTLGRCVYAAAPGGAHAVTMACVPAPGMDGRAARLLRGAGKAIYRLSAGLPTALPQGADTAGEGWAARFSPAEEGLHCAYEEKDGLRMSLLFTEINRP